ncbi:MAG: hypothetical protein AAFX40_10445 [Cyanobacteria bacterium J06639_1]
MAEYVWLTCRILNRAIALLPYEQRWNELESSSNPFAMVVMAHLKAPSTRNDIDQRKRWKLNLTRQLGQRGDSRAEIVSLYRFISSKPNRGSRRGLTGIRAPR